MPLGSEARMGGMGVYSKPMDHLTCVHGSSMGALRPPIPPPSESA